MSPEVNGNPPSVTKRKKNKKPQPEMKNFDLNMPSCNYFTASQHYSIPEMNGYYPCMNEPMSLPVYPMNYPKYSCPGNLMGSIGNLSGNSSMSHHTFNINTPDYTSLPIVNIDANEDSKRRFSDPGLLNDSDSCSNSCDDRTVKMLTQQINSLKESNNKLAGEVMQLRMELNLLKQQQTRSFEREYEPGMLADVIREVREAERVREAALLARVKHILEEKHLTGNQLNLYNEKNRNNDRISKLEEQLKNLTVSNNYRSDDSIVPSNLSFLQLTDQKTKLDRLQDLEKEAMELRRELQGTKPKRETDSGLKICQNNIIDSTDGPKSILDLAPISGGPNAGPSTPARMILTGPVTSL